MDARYVEVEQSALDDEGRVPWLAAIHDATDESVNTVLAADVGTGEGRSTWWWLRLPNGDLFLATAPQGETYFAVETDASFPGSQ